MDNQASSQTPLFSPALASRALVSLTGLGMVLLLSGCGGPDPSSMIPSGMGNMTNAGNIKTELLDTSILQTVQRINPFESQIPGQQMKLPVEPNGDPNLAEGMPNLPELPAEEIKDPFSGLEIGGIVYRKNSPMAILRSNGGSGSGLGGVVRQGDSIVIDDVTVIVAKIDKNSVTLKAPSLPNGSNSKILTVPSLIGYASTSSGTSPSLSSASKAVPRVGMEGADPNAVSEIDRMEGNIDVPQAIMDLLKEKLQQPTATP